jgi:hypothetical protein
MTYRMMSYTVKPEEAARNEELLRAVIAELHQAKPAGLRYAAFKLDDGLSYIHLVGDEAGTGHRALPQAGKDFLASIHERCDEPPVRTDLSEIGSYRLFRED